MCRFKKYIFLKLDNASFINIKSEFLLHKYHECTCGIFFFLNVKLYFTHTQINSLTITHYII